MRRREGERERGKEKEVGRQREIDREREGDGRQARTPSTILSPSVLLVLLLGLSILVVPTPATSSELYGYDSAQVVSGLGSIYYLGTN